MRSEILSDRGEGPSVVYVPGLDGTGEMLHSLAPRLETKVRLLRAQYVHEPGHDIGPATYDRLADTLVDGLRARGIQSTTLLAESFGGGVALSAALRHPAAVRSMVIVNSFAWYPQRVRIRLGAMLTAIAPRWALQRGRAIGGSRLFFRPRIDPDAEAQFHRMLAGFERPGYVERLRAIPHLDLRARLGEVDAKTYLFASTHDRVLPSRRTMAAIHDGLPNATLTPIERANHIVLPLLEEPWVERVLAAVHGEPLP